MTTRGTGYAFHLSRFATGNLVNGDPQLSTRLLLRSHRS